MLRRFSSLFIFVLFLISCSVQKMPKASVSGNRIANLIQRLENPQGQRVLVASHRCDWRNHPENSIPALKSSIAMGVDIAEIDLKKTRDGVLILMHDKTIDRNTSGKGEPKDFTLAEIKQLSLRNGLGRITDNTIPTFKEFLLEAKDKILIDIDKGYEFFPDVIKTLRETNTLNQAIININDNITLDEVEKLYGQIPEDVFIMPIIVYNDKAKAQAVAKSYLRHKRTIFQPVWKDDVFIADENFKLLKNQGFGVWLNSLWASLNGGHHDDRAVEQNQPNETWGWLIDKGATIIQTDRPKELLNYLRERKLHP